MQFFLKSVLKPEDSARYVIVVDHGLDKYGHFSSTALPDLPANAEYLSIRGCYELGHVGKVLAGLTTLQLNLHQYEYFVWLDSSVRGPFLPSYLTKMSNPPLWHTLLTSRLNSTTKLVGATISCGPVSLQSVSPACIFTQASCGSISVTEALQTETSSLSLYCQQAQVH